MDENQYPFEDDYVQRQAEPMPDIRPKQNRRIYPEKTTIFGSPLAKDNLPELVIEIPDEKRQSGVYD